MTDEDKDEDKLINFRNTNTMTTTETTTTTTTNEKDKEDEILYEEIWTPPFAPLVFFLPMFYKYGVIVSKSTSTTRKKDVADDDDEITITFGYGFTRPTSRSMTSKTVSIKNIDQESITIGNASWKDNLTRYGGWGIRLGMFDGDVSIAYNAKNGDYIEFVVVESSEESTSTNTGSKKKYRFVSDNVEAVAALMRGESGGEGVKEKVSEK